MKYIDLKAEAMRCNTPRALQLRTSVESCRGRLYDLPRHRRVSRLHDRSKRRSVTSSNEIEGIRVAPGREEELLLDRADPETQEDYLLLGYNEALEYVYANYRFVEVDESLVKNLHYLMYRRVSPEFGGKYKGAQNYIREYDGRGRLVRTVFLPPGPEEAPQLLGNLLYQLSECAKDPLVDRLYLTFAFILDFLCIHPFDDGNGRVSRLLMTLLLLKFGYTLDLYHSFSYLILDHLGGYYSSLEASGKGWADNETDPSPFAEYMLSLMAVGYGRLVYMQELDGMGGLASEKVMRVVKEAGRPIAKAEIEELLFGLSRTTIEKALGELTRLGRIALVSSGHYAKYAVKPSF